jgi:Polyketide cyclase / dehydrase and lipid transport
LTTVSSDIEIRATRACVYELISDPDRAGVRLGVRESFDRVPSQPLRRGDRFEHTIDVTGARVRIVWTATRVRRPHAVEWTGEGPGGARTVVRIALSSTGRALTRVACDCELHIPSGPLGLIADRAFGGGRAAAQVHAVLERLRDFLEAGDP